MSSSLSLFLADIVSSVLMTLGEEVAPNSVVGIPNRPPPFLAKYSSLSLIPADVISSVLLTVREEVYFDTPQVNPWLELRQLTPSPSQNMTFCVDLLKLEPFV
jgi:hypothetical protein